MPKEYPIRRALLSVSDKRGLVELAQRLHQLEIELLSTGGTAALLRSHNLPVTDISELTGFPEIMDGRIKTLHPKVHGGLLGRRDQDANTMAEHAIQPIDLLVVNLYPFEDTVSAPQCNLETAIESIDIGGPAMLRAAAKNHAFVTVIAEHSDYDRLIDEMTAQNGCTTKAFRLALAKKAFAHTARYDGLISNYFEQLDAEAFPQTLSTQFTLKQSLRYGENPHQRAALYTERHAPPPTLEQLHGKALSYNNLVDADAALECVNAFTNEPTCVIVKHTNPCGVAQAETLLAAYERAFLTDTTSAFGGIIALNTCLDAQTARAILKKQFVELIIVPEMEPGVLDIIAQKKNIRLLRSTHTDPKRPHRLDYKQVAGGLLVQDHDEPQWDTEALKLVTKRPPSNQEAIDLQFAWQVVKAVKSNAIVYAKDRATVGIGAGQMSRIDSAMVAAHKAAQAGLSTLGAVMASDAFFPFQDGIALAAQNGISAIIQPGGSIRDPEIIEAADKANMAMLFTGIRHFKH